MRNNRDEQTLSKGNAALRGRHLNFIRRKRRNNSEYALKKNKSKRNTRKSNKKKKKKDILDFLGTLKDCSMISSLTGRFPFLSLPCGSQNMTGFCAQHWDCGNGGNQGFKMLDYIPIYYLTNPPRCNVKSLRKKGLTLTARMF